MRLLILFFSLSCFASETIYVTASGDSLTAGVFAGTPGISTKNTEYKPREGSFLRKLLLYMVENHEFDWFGGTVDFSIVSRIESAGFTVDAYNSAVSGSTIEDVVHSQIPSIKSWMQSKKIEKLNMQIIFIGANDVCKSNYTDYNTFESNYMQYANSIDSVSKVFVPLPDIGRIYDFKESRNIFGMKAKNLWKITDSCPSIMAGKDMNEVIKNYNAIIKRVSDSVGGIYIDGADMLVFEKKHVNRIDIFHASKEGHKLISDLVWEKVK